jgi:hypothetical protein
MRVSWRANPWTRAATPRQRALLATMARERGCDLAELLAEVLGDGRAECVEAKDVGRVVARLRSMDVRGE